MGKIVSNSFSLQAQINGKTLITSIEVLSGSLFQYMDASGSVSPDWSAGGGSGPTFRAKIIGTDGLAYDSVTADDAEKLYYEGVRVSFDGAGDSVAVNGLEAAAFHREFDNGHYVYQITKNLFDASSNSDADSIRIEGKVSLPGGRQQDYTTPEEMITLMRYTTSGDPYVVLISNVENITDKAVKGSMTAHLHDLTNNMEEVTSGYTVKWYNVDGAGKRTECKTADGYEGVNTATLKIPETAIAGYDNFCAEFTIGGKTYRGYAAIMDLTDNIYAAYDVSGDVDGDVDGAQVKEGGTALIDIYMVDKDGQKITSWGSTTLYPHVVLKGAEGNDVNSSVLDYSGTIAQLRSAATMGIQYKSEAWKGLLKVPYSDLLSTCGGRLQGWISFDPPSATTGTI